jgi:hypothetical protein
VAHGLAPRRDRILQRLHRPVSLHPHIQAALRHDARRSACAGTDAHRLKGWGLRCSRLVVSPTSTGVQVTPDLIAACARKCCRSTLFGSPKPS